MLSLLTLLQRLQLHQLLRQLRLLLQQKPLRSNS
jgi:hypothetical protein